MAPTVRGYMTATYESFETPQTVNSSFWSSAPQAGDTIYYWTNPMTSGDPAGYSLYQDSTQIKCWRRYPATGNSSDDFTVVDTMGAVGAICFVGDVVADGCDPAAWSLQNGGATPSLTVGSAGHELTTADALLVWWGTCNDYDYTYPPPTPGLTSPGAMTTRADTTDDWDSGVGFWARTKNRLLTQQLSSTTATGKTWAYSTTNGHCYASLMAFKNNGAAFTARGPRIAR